MKLAIIVGHNSASQGAVRQDVGETKALDFLATPGGGVRIETFRHLA